MLAINPEIVCEIIDRARNFQAKEGLVLPEDADNLSEYSLQEAFSEHQGDMSYEEVSTTIDEDLDAEQQAELVALMWLGRGDFAVEEWERGRKEALERLSDHTAKYLLATPMIADYLEEGLDLLGYRCE